MDFAPTEKVAVLVSQLERFMDEFVYSNESVAAEQIEASGDPHHEPEIVEELKERHPGGTGGAST